jgi:type I restriction enzyme S subunit
MTDVGLPSTWTRARINDVAFVNPRVGFEEVGDDTVVSFVPMAAVSEEVGLIDATQQKPWRDVKRGFTKFIENDVIFAKITPCMENGKIAVVRGLKSGVGAGSTEFHVLRAKPGINPDYLRLFLVQQQYRQNAERHMTGAVGQRRVPTEYLSSSSIPVAPKTEQHRIVAKIDELFSQIDEGERNLKRVQTLLKQYRQSVLKAAVTGELTKDWRAKNARKGETGADLLKRILVARREAWEAAELAKLSAKGKAPKNDDWKKKYVEPAAPDTSNIPKLPDGWVWASIDQVGFVSGGLTKNSKRSEVRRKMPYLRVGNVYAGQLDLERIEEIGVEDNEIERVLLRPNDLLIVEGNGSPDQIGRVALWDGSISPCVHQNHLIKVRSINAELARWFLVVLLSSIGRSQIERVSSSTSGLHTLSITKIAKLAIPVGPLNEIRTALEGLDAVLSGQESIEQNQHELQRQIASLRQSVLRAAFSGRLVPQDSSDEPAAELLKRIALIDGPRIQKQSSAPLSRGPRKKNKEGVAA